MNLLIDAFSLCSSLSYAVELPSAFMPLVSVFLLKAAFSSYWLIIYVLPVFFSLLVLSLVFRIYRMGKEKKQAIEHSAQRRYLLEKANENLNRAILEEHHLFWIVDKDFRLISFNKGLKDMLFSLFDFELKVGISALLPVFNEKNRLEWQQKYEQALQGKEVHYRIEFGDYTMNFRIFPLRQNEGQIDRVAISGLDDSKLTEGQFTEARFERIKADSDGFFARFNHHCVVNFFSYRNNSNDFRRDDPADYPHLDRFLPTQICSNIKEHMHGINDAGEYIFDFQDTDKKSWYRAKVYYSAKNSKQIRDYSIFVTDISDEKQARDFLEDQYKTISKTIETIPIPLFYKIANGRFLGTNKAFNDFFGVHIDKNNSFGFHDFLSKTDFEQMYAVEQKSLTEQSSQKHHISLTSPDGLKECILCMNSFLTSRFNEKVIIGVLFDITETRLYEKQLEEAREHAIAANRAKSEFLANMSHEIRTPMNAVIGFTELLESMTNEPKQIGYLKTIKAAGQSLLKLINDILDLSRIEAGRLELKLDSVNLFGLVNEVRQVFFGRVLEKKLEFYIDVQKDMPESLILDENRLRQILFNLAGNAVKFTHEGSVGILVRHKQNEEDPSKIDIRIEVHDTGVGIPDEELQTVFEEFTQREGQSNRRYGGTGLGLSITKSLVHLMEGEIKVKSEEGKGSVFSVLLQGVDIGLTDFNMKSPEFFDFRSLVFEPARMLIVDDVKPNRDLVREVFRDSPIEIIQAENGQQAIILAQEYMPDLILMDIRMPIMDGHEATMALKKDVRTKHIPIVALTASVLVRELKLIKTSGFDAYLKKPVSRSEIFRELSRFLKHSSVEQSIIKEKTKKLVSKQQAEALPGILDTLEKEVMILWEEIQQRQSMERTETFAHQIIELGKQYQIKLLLDFGYDVLESVEQFDIDRLSFKINTFPVLIERVAALGNAEIY